MKTTEQSLEQFDVLVNAWSRQRKVSTNNIAVAIWDKKLKLAKLVKQKGKSLSKFGYSGGVKMKGGRDDGDDDADVVRRQRRRHGILVPGRNSFLSGN